MKIDFSMSMADWEEVIRTFLGFINDFWEQIFGEPLFTESSAGALDDYNYDFGEDA